MAMYVVTRFLILATITLYGLAKEDDVYCGNVVPGLAMLMTSVDITELDLLPFDGSGIGGARRPIFRKTCEKGRIVTTSYNGKTYQLPHQADDYISTPSGSSVDNALIYRSYHQVKKAMATAAGVRGMYSGFGFSLSGSYATMQNSISSSSKHIIDVFQTRNTHKINLTPGSSDNVLSPHFEKAIDNLKGKTYKDHKSDFDDFIEIYGTHYFYRGFFGGKIRQYVEINSDYSSEKSDDALRIDAEASFQGTLIGIGASVSVDKKTKTASSEYLASRKEQQMYYGGRANLLSKNGMTNWTKSVELTPQLLTAKTRQLYRLVKDKTTKAELRKATEEYVMRNFIEEMKRKLVNLQGRIPFPTLNAWRKRLEKESDETILVIKKIKDLNAEIVKETEIPAWFKEGVRLCFRFEEQTDDPKTRVQYCGYRDYTSNQPTTYCTTPGKWTDTYVDYVTMKGHSCLLEWGLFSVAPPDWFQGLELCMKFTITGVEKEYNNTERCAKMNSYLRPLNDQTRQYTTKNTYQWKIKKSPENKEEVPLWFKQTKFCLDYKGMGGNPDSHCFGSGKPVCGKYSQWTEPFIDHTHYSGGCYMRWGFDFDGSLVKQLL